MAAPTSNAGVKKNLPRERRSLNRKGVPGLSAGYREVTMTSGDLNEAAFASSETVAEYARMGGLHRCEEYLFAKYVRPGDAILDIGVGAGRTAPHLAPGASLYVGIDYSQAMVDAARRRFPGLDFRWGDAANLFDFEEGRFDLVVFSFNGMSYLPSDETRGSAFGETARVLKPGGKFIFSVPNSEFLLFLPDFRGASLKQKLALGDLSLEDGQSLVAAVQERGFPQRPGLYFRSGPRRHTLVHGDASDYLG